MSPDSRAENRTLQRHRRMVIGVLALLIAAFVTTVILVQTSPVTTALATDTVLLNSITVLIILLLLVLLFVLGRNLTKLYIERRRRKLGSRFSTKVVVTYIGMALVPCVLLFLAASNLIQRGLTMWFSPATTDIVNRARRIGEQSALDQEDQLLVTAQDIADMITEGRLLSRDAWQLLRRDIDARRQVLLLDAVSIFAGDQLFIDPIVDPEGPFATDKEASPVEPRSSGQPSAAGTDLPALPAAQITLALNGQPFKLQTNLSDGTVLVHAGVPIYAPNRTEVEGVVVAARRLPSAMRRGP